jgi:hypothetical protein
MDSGKAILNKQGQPEQTLKWDFNKPLSKFRVGPYSAQLVLVYDDGQRDVPIKASLNFTVVPWKILTVLAVFFIAVGVLAWRYIKMRRRLKKVYRSGL